MEFERTQCMRYNDTIYLGQGSAPPAQMAFPTYTYGLCSIPIGINENPASKAEIRIAPNPFYSSLKVFFDNKVLDEKFVLNIYNSLGIIC